MRGATALKLEEREEDNISTHAPLAGRDLHVVLIITISIRHFNPRAPCGARREQARATRKSDYFNPRAPCGARPSQTGKIITNINFNPRAPCGARQEQQHQKGRKNQISTHAPLAGRDHGGNGAYDRKERISTHAPLAGRDVYSFFVPIAAYLFQPTRPLRGATDTGDTPSAWAKISTHAPLAGRDTVVSHDQRYSLSFQPTRPLRGATAVAEARVNRSYHFNPRAPCGARRPFPGGLDL